MTMRLFTVLLIAFVLVSLACQQDKDKIVPVKKSSKKPTETKPAKLPAPKLKLPTGQVTAEHVWMSGQTSEYDLGLSGIGQGFSITDGRYPGWCVEDNYQDNTDNVALFSSYDPNMPEDIKYYMDPSIPKGKTGGLVPWDKLNYLINHKQGTLQDVGAAIFILLWGQSLHFPANDTVIAMVNDAETNGSGFIPKSGQLMAIILYQDGLGDDMNPEDKNRTFQDTFIEYQVP